MARLGMPRASSVRTRPVGRDCAAPGDSVGAVREPPFSSRRGNRTVDLQGHPSWYPIVGGQARDFLCQEITRPAPTKLETIQIARIRLLRGFSSTSASPSFFSTGGTYIPKRPRRPFFKPYQPPTGFFGDRPPLGR